MSERTFKKGERVLVEAEMQVGPEGKLQPQWEIAKSIWAGIPHIHDHAHAVLHRHPGVSVADLLEELELVWQRLCRCQASSLGSRYDNLEPQKQRSEELREAREKAQEPKMKEGDGAWVFATVVDGPDRDGWPLLRIAPGSKAEWRARIHPDDIRPSHVEGDDE